MNMDLAFVSKPHQGSATQFKVLYYLHVQSKIGVGRRSCLVLYLRR